MDKKAKIYVAGHRGLAGSAIMRELIKAGYDNIIGKTHAELELEDQNAVNAFFEAEHPEVVILCAAKVGGIKANYSYPWDFIRSNLAIQCNVINASVVNNVKKFIFLGSSCIYPRSCDQPMKESYLFTAPLENTNRAYAVAKLAGVEMCMAAKSQLGKEFVAVLPCNMYGFGDTYNSNESHVIPALLMKFRDAVWNNKTHVECWGTGSALREFLHADDFGKAMVKIMETDKLFQSVINIGHGREYTISELVYMIKKITGYTGRILWNHDEPDGTPRKVMDSSYVKDVLGWEPEIDLEAGLKMTYDKIMEGTEY